LPGLLVVFAYDALTSVTPKSSLGCVKALLYSIYDQPNAGSVHAQFDRVVDALAEQSGGLGSEHRSSESSAVRSHGRIWCG
jgi:hypothetical protein